MAHVAILTEVASCSLFRLGWRRGWRVHHGLYTIYSRYIFGAKTCFGSSDLLEPPPYTSNNPKAFVQALAPQNLVETPIFHRPERHGALDPKPECLKP